MTTDSRPASDDLFASEEIRERTSRALAAIMRTIMWVLPAIMVMVTLTGHPAGEVVALSGMVVVALASLLILRRGHLTAATFTLVFGIILFCATAIAALGSVRSMATFGILAAIAAGGMLLPFRLLAALTAFASAAVGALIAAENAGALPTRALSVGWLHWAVFTLIAAAIAVNVSYGRGLILQVVRRLENELQGRRQAEAALVEREDLLAKTLRASPAALAVATLDGSRIRDVNESYERIFDMPRDRLIGRAVRDAGVWADPADREPYLALLREKGRVTNYPGRFRRPSGEFDALISGEIVTIEGVAHVITAHTDITEMTAAREALRRSEERFRRYFRLNPIATTITRLRDAMVLDINEAAERLTGYANREIAGSSVTSSGIWIEPAERDDFIARLREDGQVSAYPARLRKRDGQALEVQLWGTLSDVDGESCILTSIVNVTEQRREEALLIEVAHGVAGETGDGFFRSLVTHLQRATGADMALVGEQIGDKVRTLAVYRDGALAANFEYLLEGSPCEAAQGSGGLCFYGDGVAERFPRDVALAKGGMRSYIGYAMRGPDGEAIGVINALARHPFGEEKRLESLFRIFAARAQAELMRLRHERHILAMSAGLEQRVVERTMELEQVNRELESFSYSVSHDLRAPLRAIEGFARLLDEEHSAALGEEGRGHILRVRNAVQRMGQLINDLLELARMARVELRPSVVDLTRLVEEIVAELHAASPQRQVEVQVASGQSAYGDSRLLRIALANLIGNAWKYTGKTDRPRVEFGVTDKDGENVYFVRDNGAGFDMRYAERLFGAFQRLHSEHEFPGTGVGLATVARIVHRHGGRVWAKGDPGRGATFHFTLKGSGAA